MALNDILAAMEAEVAAEIQQMAAQAAEVAEQSRLAAEADACAIMERHNRAALIPLERERARRLNRARLAALAATSRVHEQLLADALAGARMRLGALRDTPEYPAILRALAEEALAGVEGDAFLHADPRDARLLRELFPGLQVDGDMETLGGVEAHSLDGRIVVINTLEARLEQARPLLWRVVAPLFISRADIWATTTTPTHDYAR